MTLRTPNWQYQDPLTNRMVNFLTDIGIRVYPKKFDKDYETFLPGISVNKGTLLVDESRLAYPGDLLHEAGHLAVTPANERVLLSDNMTLPGELAAIAWSYAALLYLGLEPTVVFHPEGYKGESVSIMEHFSQGLYFGVPILTWREMTFDDEQAKKKGVLPYPAMERWLCD